jgi:hypothetical protein
LYLALQTSHEHLIICNFQWLFCLISPKIWDQYFIQNIIRHVYIIKGKALSFNIILWDIQQMHKNVCHSNNSWQNILQHAPSCLKWDMTAVLHFKHSINSAAIPHSS